MSPVSFDSSQLYDSFVEEVDAIDNGVSQYDGEARYAISSTMSARVGHLNPRWNSKSQDTEVSASEWWHECACGLTHRTLVLYQLDAVELNYTS